MQTYERDKIISIKPELWKFPSPSPVFPQPITMVISHQKKYFLFHDTISFFTSLFAKISISIASMIALFERPNVNDSSLYNFSTLWLNNA